MEPKRLYKAKTTPRMLMGVCGGIAEYFNIDPTVVRLVVAVLSLGSWGGGLVLYFLAGIIIPEPPANF